jgi:protein-S-isoprenylcysteine O-methyltransferase Ste14
MLEGALFVAVTLGILFFSRTSLRVPGSHGFYRFFAWELLLLLFILNMRRWFTDPFSAHQLVSWLLLFVSLYMVGQGLLLLRRRGQPDSSRSDESLLGLEKTTALVTDGIYRYVRHPLYSSLFFLGWGIFFKAPSWPAGLLSLLAALFLFLTARVEEGENIRYFGAAYQAYMKRTKMFVPFLF